MSNPYLEFLAEEARWQAEFGRRVLHPLLTAWAERVDRMWSEEQYPDVYPWFHTTTEPGPYTEDWEDGYPYDTGAGDE